MYTNVWKHREKNATIPISSQNCCCVSSTMCVPLYSPPSNWLRVSWLWQQWENFGGGVMGEWDSFKGSLKSGWRWGHPQGQGVRTAFYVLCKCYNKRLAASHMCGGKQSRVAVAFAPKLDKPHKRRASRGTGTTGQWSQKSATVCHHPPFSLHRCGAALPLNLF